MYACENTVTFLYFLHLLLYKVILYKLTIENLSIAILWKIVSYKEELKQLARINIINSYYYNIKQL